MSVFLPVLAETALVIPGWAWVAFLGFVIFMLALDLGVFNKTDHMPSFKEAVAWCVVWVSLAVGFGFLLSAWRGPEDAQLFAAGYVLELALSVDNLFIFILVFAHFKIPDHLQHRVLFWGIIGAVVMRAAFIIVGVAAGVAVVADISALIEGLQANTLAITRAQGQPISSRAMKAPIA